MSSVMGGVETFLAVSEGIPNYWNKVIFKENSTA